MLGFLLRGFLFAMGFFLFILFLASGLIYAENVGNDVLFYMLMG